AARRFRCGRRRDLRAGGALPHRPSARRRLLSGQRTGGELGPSEKPVAAAAFDGVDDGSVVTPLDPLGQDAVDAIAALCSRALADAPAADEIEACLFAADQPSTVRGDPDVGVVATAPIDGQGFIRLLVVDP